VQTDPTLAKIAAQFTKFDIESSRGAYVIVDRRTSNPIARLRPISGHGSLRTVLLVELQRSLDDLRQHGTHETDVEKRSRDRGK
jgi:hypothetical protein